MDLKWLKRVFWTMFALLTGLSVLVVGWLPTLTAVVLIVVNFYLFTLLIYILGNRNIFFTVVQEGSVKGVTRIGRAHRCVMAYRGHRFRGEIGEEFGTEDLWGKDEYWNVVEFRRYLEENSVTFRRPDEGFFREFMRQVLFVDLGGLHFVGMWPFYRVYTYQFKFTSLRGELPPDFEAGDIRYRQSRVITLDSILVRQETYALEIKGVEDKNLIPVDIRVILTGHIVNPFKALFRVQEWLETSANRLLAYIRLEFGRSTWEEFQAKYYKGAGNLEGLLKPITDDIRNFYGFETVGVEISEFTPPTEFAEASLAVRRAQADAEAAEHEARAIRTRAAAERNLVKTVYQAATEFKEDGVAMKIVEDLSKGANTTILLPGSLVESLRSFFRAQGGNP